MKHITWFLLFSCSIFKVYAQKSIAGEYSLRGVPEVASGLKFNADSSFEFYFSYGALDRYGSGKWSINKNNIVLNSKPYPGKDYKLLNAVDSKNNFSMIRIENENTNLYSLVYCRFKSAQQDTMINFDETGTVIVPYAVDSIELLSELCAERRSTFAIKSSPAVYTFNFEPWVVEVFFDRNAWHFSNDFLEGTHPLLNDKTYRFYKEK